MIWKARAPIRGAPADGKERVAWNATDEQGPTGGMTAAPHHPRRPRRRSDRLLQGGVRRRGADAAAHGRRRQAASCTPISTINGGLADAQPTISPNIGQGGRDSARGSVTLHLQVNGCRRRVEPGDRRPGAKEKMPNSPTNSGATATARSTDPFGFTVVDRRPSSLRRRESGLSRTGSTRCFRRRCGGSPRRTAARWSGGGSCRLRSSASPVDGIGDHQLGQHDWRRPAPRRAPDSTPWVQ